MCHAGRRKEIAQPRNNGCGGWQTSEGSKGEQRDFPMAKIPPTALGRCWHQGRECKGTARPSGQCPGVRASCTARHSTVCKSSAKQLAQPLRGTRCTDLPDPTARHSWGQPEPPACSWAGSATAHPKRRGTAAPTLAGERDTPVPSREGIQGGTAAVRNS